MIEELVKIELEGWRALSSEVKVAQDFYGRLLSEDAVMLLPGGMVLEGKDQILRSFEDQPWEAFEIQEPRAVTAGERAVVLAYRVVANREGGDDYRALISSVYHRRKESWVLCFHQHTPI